MYQVQALMNDGSKYSAKFKTLAVAEIDYSTCVAICKCKSATIINLDNQELMAKFRREKE